MCRGGVRKQSARRSLRVLNGTWVEAAEVHMLRSVRLLVAAQWTGTHSTSLLCFVAVEQTLMPMHDLLCICHCCCAHHCGLCIMESIHKADSEPCRLSLFLDLSWSLSWFRLWSLSLDLSPSLSLCLVVHGLCSLSELHTVRPPPHGAAVNGIRVMVWVTVRRGQIPHLDQSSRTAQYHLHQGQEVARQAQQTQPYPNWRIQAAGRVAGAQVHIGRV